MRPFFRFAEREREREREKEKENEKEKERKRKRKRERERKCRKSPAFDFSGKKKEMKERERERERERETRKTEIEREILYDWSAQLRSQVLIRLLFFVVFVFLDFCSFDGVVFFSFLNFFIFDGVCNMYIYIFTWVSRCSGVGDFFFFSWCVYFLKNVWPICSSHSVAS